MKKKAPRSTLHEVMVGRKNARHVPRAKKREKDKLRRQLEERARESNHEPSPSS